MANDLVFITGGTGHIGFRTLVIALQLGYSVRAAVIMSLWINVTVVMMVTVVSRLHQSDLRQLRTCTVAEVYVINSANIRGLVVAI